MTNDNAVIQLVEGLDLDSLLYEAMDSGMPAQFAIVELLLKPPSKEIECTLAELRSRIEALTPDRILKLRDSVFPIHRDDIETLLDSSADNSEARDPVLVVLQTTLHSRFFGTHNLVHLHKAPSSRVLSEYPELKTKFNKDGLLRVPGDLTLTTDGVLTSKHLIPFHPFLGHCHSTDPDCDFLARLVQLANESPKLKVYMAIDHQRLVARHKIKSLAFEDYWRGLPFDRKVLDDEHFRGLTVYGAPSAKENKTAFALCLMGGISRLEVYQSAKEGLRTFEFEEVISEGNSRTPRYSHAQWNISGSHIQHFDGALMLYSEFEQVERAKFDCTLPDTPKAADKPKLFRIDGELDAETWCKLNSLFYRGNPLIHEFYAGHTGSSAEFETETEA